MTNYTIIWQDEGEYFYQANDYGSDINGHIREELHIETFTELSVALTRYARIECDEETSTLVLLINGIPHYETHEWGDIEEQLRTTYREHAQAVKRAREEAALQARVAAEQARVELERQCVAALEERQRAMDLETYHTLKARLGL